MPTHLLAFFFIGGMGTAQAASWLVITPSAGNNLTVTPATGTNLSITPAAGGNLTITSTLRNTGD